MARTARPLLAVALAALAAACAESTYPTSGTAIRSMRATVTFAGQSPESRSRREVITYNGTSTASITITENGTSKTCALPLPHGRPNCP